MLLSNCTHDIFAQMNREMKHRMSVVNEPHKVCYVGTSQLSSPHKANDVPATVRLSSPHEANDVPATVKLKAPAVAVEPNIEHRTPPRTTANGERVSQAQNPPATARTPGPGHVSVHGKRRSLDGCSELSGAASGSSAPGPMICPG
ncbi:hypothetical protein WMY93_028905 [Mugilogobius chulae]|uniref:Uncharacterized protein n=1 Tax=Mugilogobius chulae TaxID=88201 RepID=A0AAW0N1I8_9GOBI